MIVTVNSQHLAGELRLLNKIVPTKPAIVILSHVLLQADERGLHLWATDLEVGLSTDCQAAVTQPGKVALPLARLLSLVEQFPNADVSIQADDTKIAIACGAFNGRLQALPANDFPAAPPVDGQMNVIDGDDFRRLIARTRYAINATAQKFAMQGALLTLHGTGAVMVTTDAKRLALATATRAGTDASMIVPAKALDALANADGAEVEVTVGRRHLHFTYGGRTLTSRTIDGKFPAYERIIPRDNDKVVTVGKGDLTSALKRVILVAEDDRRTYLAITTDKITLAARSQEVGQADEAVRAEYAGVPLKVCVNGGYVLDFLEAAQGTTVQMHFKDANGAMMMMDGEDHVGVIMLMKG